MRPRPSRHRQLLLDLKGQPAFEADDFLVSPCNADAHHLIDLWPDWAIPMLMLVGPPGSGKSHLGSIWAGRASALVIRPEDTLPKSPSDAALVEDADRRTDEAELFHFLNMMRETNLQLVLTARLPPDRWNITTPDLLSRLRQIPLTVIQEADEGLISSVLVKIFADRQLRVDEGVVRYAAKRLERSFEAVERFVDAMDKFSMERGSRVTRSLATSFLSDQEETADHGPI